MALSEEVLAMTFSEANRRHNNNGSGSNTPILSIDGMLMDSGTIAGVLKEAQKRLDVRDVILRNIALDHVIAQAAEELFQADTRNWDRLELIHCTGPICRIIQASVRRVQHLCFTGSVPIAHNPRYSLDTQSLQAIGKALVECPRLTTCSLKGTRLSQAGILALGQGLGETTTLKSLLMSHCAVHLSDVALLRQALGKNRHLISLSLAHCKFGSMNGDFTTSVVYPSLEFALLLEALVPHPTLQSLNIYGIYCDMRCTKALGRLLQANHTQLRRLAMKNNPLHPDEKVPVAPIIEALGNNTKLTYLQLSGNNVDDDDMEHLSQILSQKNRTLQALSLTANQIRDDGLTSLAKRLPSIKALRFLDVQRNLFTDTSKKQIIAALKDNVELERLDLDGTWDATKSYYLSLNKGGRRLLQSSNAMPISLWPNVLARVNALQFGRNQPLANINVLYCLLVEGPVLFGRGKKREPSLSSSPVAKRLRLESNR